MDLDPELDVTLSDGRQSVTFQIAAAAGNREAWAIVEPLAPFRVILGCAEALEMRRRLDTLIAQRLVAGWVPVDAGPAGTPLVPPTPLPPDLALHLSSLLEALDRARPALCAADPTGRLWAACHVFLRQARRFGVGGPGARVARAQRERRLAELAEQAGDIPAAILHYRAALASHAGVGVRRRLTLLARHWPSAEPAAEAPPAASSRAGIPRDGRAPRRGDGSRGAAVRDRSSGARARHAETQGAEMKATRVQIVGRLPMELNRRVRAEAKRRKVTLNTFLIEALTQAVAERRRSPETKGV